MGSTARGRLLRAMPLPGSGRGVPAMLRPVMHVPGSGTTAATVLNDYWWGTGVAAPPAAAQIPVCWLSQPVRLRFQPPYNQAAVSQISTGIVSRASNTASIDAFGARPFTADLSTANNADPANLASWTVAYRSEPRMTAPTLVIDLLYRTDSERRLILGVTQGQRIEITGVPAEFPEGASSLVVTGIGHTVSVKSRRVTWTTSAVVGAAPGVPGPWFYLDSSVLDGPDAVPF